jgi:hypothetical protein
MPLSAPWLTNPSQKTFTVTVSWGAHHITYTTRGGKQRRPITPFTRKDNHTMRVTLTNDFHHTTVTLNVNDESQELSPGQISRTRKALCGIDGCECGGVVGQRGPQTVTVTTLALGRVGVSIDRY